MEIIRPPPLEIVTAPITVLAPESAAPATTTLEQDRDGVSRRFIEERAAPNTTAEQDRKSASQRRINLIWEYTQAVIAAAVIGTTLMVDANVALWSGSTSEYSSSAMMQLNVMAALVTGFYFGRTNHQRTGGIGGENAGPRGTS